MIERRVTNRRRRRGRRRRRRVMDRRRRRVIKRRRVTNRRRRRGRRRRRREMERGRDKRSRRRRQQKHNPLNSMELGTGAHWGIGTTAWPVCQKMLWLRLSRWGRHGDRTDPQIPACDMWDVENRSACV